MSAAQDGWSRTARELAPRWLPEVIGCARYGFDISSDRQTQAFPIQAYGVLEDAWRREVGRRLDADEDDRPPRSHAGRAEEVRDTSYRSTPMDGRR